MSLDNTSKLSQPLGEKLLINDMPFSEEDEEENVEIDDGNCDAVEVTSSMN